ncbi:hypothetical protein [Microbacterium sp. J1-1]|uniref:hypothetical protein n=1 Tax=Microbacterium sp. J1-1 TaxID=2992441 RepID=UPI002114EC3E|nr:hypothetical protein [Microbacterium sp. J1-1]UUE19876.1 hypothetical protein LRQ07_13910 [Microbacterium sp. J1-1]
MSTPKEKAAVLLEQGDGTIPKESVDMSTTVPPATGSLPVKQRTTIARRRSNYTAEERAFARTEGLHSMDTRYLLTVDPRSESFTTPDGDSFRSAGHLWIRTCRDGVRRFTAYMNDESTNHDFQYLDEVILDARNGRMDGWERHVFRDGDEGWRYDYPNYQIDRLTDFKPAHVIITHGSTAKKLVGYGEAWGYPCEEARCREAFHEAQEVNHTLDTLDKQLTKRSSYEIEICKDISQPDSEWYVNFWTSPDMTELTPEQIATLANDLQWMGLECATTNAKEKSA